MKRYFIFLIVFTLIFSCAGFSQSLKDEVEEINLKNGMTFLILKRDKRPVFSGILSFKVGGVDEQTGATGLAHMFEHMAFKGTKTIGTKSWGKEKPVYKKIEKVGAKLTRQKNKQNKDEKLINKLENRLKELQSRAEKITSAEAFSSIYEKNGADSLNAGTGKDSTTYMVELPSNRLELWMLMESERFKNPVLREFYKERNVVLEELRSSNTSPGNILYEALVTTAFKAHPYGFPTIGWQSDVKSLTRTQAREFLNTYYVPQNAVGVLVGDIDIGKARKLIKKYFGDIPAGEESPEVVTEEPEQRGERRVKIEYDAEPRLRIGYHIPSYPHPDSYILSAISQILTGGDSSRLEKKLVKEKKIARYISSYTAPGDRYPNLFSFSSQPIQPNTCKDIEQAIYEELENLKTEPVSEKELQKVRNNLKANFIYRLESNIGVAFRLSHFEMFRGGWENIDNYVKKISEVTPEQIMETAKKYFKDTNRTVATLATEKPEPKEDKKGEKNDS